MSEGDSNTAKGTVQRVARRIQTRYLWLEEHVAERRLKVSSSEVYSQGGKLFHIICVQTGAEVRLFANGGVLTCRDHA